MDPYEGRTDPRCTCAGLVTFDPGCPIHSARIDLKENPMSDNKAVVLFSGGQDSTTCLMWAVDRFGRDNVFPLCVDYNQRHRQELIQAEQISDLILGRLPRTVTLEVLEQLGGAALTDPDVPVSADASGTGNVFAESHGLPSTFVPGRNMLFLTTALAYGATFGAYDVVTGVCEADAAGYPDCRGEFIQAAQRALRAALDEPFVNLHAPLLRLNKAKTFQLADELDALDIVLELTSTCYHGTRDERHSWGYGCGECPACLERAKGWLEFETRETQAIGG
jgi:7-cyano-7-deazaguanine synthase